MGLKVGINGFGRIGRVFFRCALKYGLDAEVVAVNDITDPRTLAHLLKYDSVHGVLDSEVKYSKDSITVDGREIKVLSRKDPGELPWSDLGVDVVVESSGLFTKRADASKHLKAGAKKVIISAPSEDADVTIVFGVNDKAYDHAKHQVISLASCTTNCLAPVVKVLNDGFGVRHALMSTAHAYTNDQRILDLPHKDLRRARAGALSIIPTTTGAAIATTLALPELRGKIHGIALRVPVPNGSLVDLVAELKREATTEAINEAFKRASEGPMKGILEYTEDPIVSVDCIGNPHSSIVDGASTMVMDGTMAKVLAWYDNEWGYSCRIVDMVRLLSKKMG
ncbi:MAG: type I glyceraldehyde-3-phosphate dehydrogenase [Candidatus Bathyarchaeia archaeon]